MARTLRAVFDRAVFPDNRPFASEALGDTKSEERNKLEVGVNWLSRKHNNLVESMRNSPVAAAKVGQVQMSGSAVHF